MKRRLEIQKPDSMLPIVTTNEVLNTTDTQARIDSFEPSKDEFENHPILPRVAWSSQLAFLKAILRAKQALDKS